MFRRQAASHTSPHPSVVFLNPDPAVLSAIAQASALMAQADGQAEDIERQGFLRFLRSRDLLHRFGRKASLSAYQAALEQGTPQDDLFKALLEGASPHTASLVAAAAAYVAAADGMAHPAEVELLQRLRDQLGLVGHVQRALSA